MPVAPKITDFMTSLARDLVEKKGVAESSANAYVKTLYLLNEKVPFKTLSFLRHKEEMMNKIEKYAPSTQKSVLAAIVSVLTTLDKPTYKPIHKFFYEKMMEKTKPLSEEEQMEKTKKQKENWVDWSEITSLCDERRKKVEQIAEKKTISKADYDFILETLVLSLYVCIQPRRNQDYTSMLIVKKYTDGMPENMNYYDVANHRFIFHKYKTAKKYGTQIIVLDATNPLVSIINNYLKFHAPFKASKGKDAVPFLVNADGKPLLAVNTITRLLNKIFKKKVGSSLLRHIFLSDKYNVDEMRDDAEAMGHSMSEQKKYLRSSDEQEVVVPII